MQSRFRDLKHECFDANVSLPVHGLADLTFGNASIADRDRHVFCIKPSGVDYKKLKPEDMVVVDMDGRQIEGRMRASSDSDTHRRLYQAFEGIKAIVHSHSRHAVSFAQAGRDIPCLGTTHADFFYGDVPVTRPLTPEEINGAYEWETGNVIVERFAGINPLEMPAVLVHGHGPFTWEVSGAKAVETAVALEIVAEMTIRSMILNPEMAQLDAALIARHFFRKHGVNATYGQPRPL